MQFTIFVTLKLQLSNPTSGVKESICIDFVLFVKIICALFIVCFLEVHLCLKGHGALSTIFGVRYDIT